MSLDARLVGDGLEVPCLDGTARPYLGLDAAASTAPLVAVQAAVEAFVPWYSSVHRGAGYASQVSTAAYEAARSAVAAFAGREGDDDVTILVRNTTEAINQLAYRLGLERDDVVVTTVLEHHANLLPWARVARRRFVECSTAGTFDLADVERALDEAPGAKLLAVTGASNVTGWLPPVDELVAAAHRRGVLVLVDAAQLAPHRALPLGADFVVFSGHKLYAPYGTGVLIGPRAAFATGEPFLAGGGAVELVDLDEVVWSDPPEREEAGSPNVIGAVALAAAVGELGRYGFAAIERHDAELSRLLRRGLGAIEGVHVLGPKDPEACLPVASFVVDGVPHALVAARLSAEFAIGVRHGCFCAHPYLVRLLGLGAADLERFRRAARRRERDVLPGAVRVSGGLTTTPADLERFLAALDRVAHEPPPVAYDHDPSTGEYWPAGFARADGALAPGAACSAT